MRATPRGREGGDTHPQRLLHYVCRHFIYRAIRSELHDQQARNQIMQVLLFEMQTDQTAISRATQRTDDAKSKLSEVLEGERRGAADTYGTLHEPSSCSLIRPGINGRDFAGFKLFS